MEDGDLPVTRKELQSELDGVKREIIEAVQEAVRDSQTEILKAFFPFQEASNTRMSAAEAKLSSTDASLGQRMSIIERRLWEIEKKLLLNPPAA